MKRRRVPGWLLLALSMVVGGIAWFYRLGTLEPASADCWRWLAENGRVTDACRAAIAKSAALSPNLERLQRIAEPVT